MTGKHVRPKGEPKPQKSGTKPFKAAILLEYHEFSGNWGYTVIFPYMVTGVSHGQFQTWREAAVAAREAWDEHKPTDPAPDVVVCYTYEQYYAEIKKAGWR